MKIYCDPCLNIVFMFSMYNDMIKYIHYDMYFKYVKDTGMLQNKTSVID